jgi:hypothetical protein
MPEHKIGTHEEWQAAVMAPDPFVAPYYITPLFAGVSGRERNRVRRAARR